MWARGGRARTTADQSERKRAFSRSAKQARLSAAQKRWTDPLSHPSKTKFLSSLGSLFLTRLFRCENKDLQFDAKQKFKKTDPSFRRAPLVCPIRKRPRALLHIYYVSAPLGFTYSPREHHLSANSLDTLTSSTSTELCRQRGSARRGARSTGKQGGYFIGRAERRAGRDADGAAVTGDPVGIRRLTCAVSIGEVRG